MFGIQALIWGVVSSSDDSASQDDRDSQRPNEEAAPKRVHRGTQQDRKAFKHCSGQCRLKGHREFPPFGPNSTNTSRFARQAFRRRHRYRLQCG